MGSDRADTLNRSAIPGTRALLLRSLTSAISLVTFIERGLLTQSTSRDAKEKPTIFDNALSRYNFPRLNGPLAVRLSV